MWPNHHILASWKHHILRAVLAMLCSCMFSSCVITRTFQSSPVSMDLVVTPTEWRIEKAEKQKKLSWVEKAVARITGPPAIVSGLVVEYWMTHDQTWPTSYEQLDLDKIGIKAVLRRVKSVTITPVDGNSAVIEMLYDSNIPARVKLNVDLEDGVSVSGS